ncbi:MAG: energy transducer TonB [Salibacteraceae bacterium]
MAHTLVIAQENPDTKLLVDSSAIDSSAAVPDQLGNRKIIERPQIMVNPKWVGRVVINIWVTPEGTVHSAIFQGDASTTENTELILSAIDAAKATLFEPLADAPALQTGTVTFTFGESTEP